MRPEFIKILSVLVLISALYGCGYRFVGGGSLPAGTGDICVTIFENPTGDTGFGNTITNDIIIELNRNDRKVVNSIETADSVLSGKILSITTDTSARSTDLTSVEKKVTVLLSAELKKKNGTTLWENGNIKYEGLYLSAAQKTVEDRNREVALEEISEEFARGLFGLMSQDF